MSDILNCCPTVYQIVHGKLKIKIREKNLPSVDCLSSPHKADSKKFPVENPYQHSFDNYSNPFVKTIYEPKYKYDIFDTESEYY